MQSIRPSWANGHGYGYGFGRRSNYGSRAKLALGVDGVLALDYPPAVDAVEHTVSASGKWSRTVLIPDGARDRLAALASSFDIVWASAWSYNAHGALREVLDLPEKPWPFLPVQFDAVAVVQEYAAGAPWVLVDEFAGDADLESRCDGVIRRVDPSRGLMDIEPSELIDAVAKLQAGVQTPCNG